VIYYRVIGIMRAAYKIENLPRALLGKISLRENIKKEAEILTNQYNLIVSKQTNQPLQSDLSLVK